MGHEKVNILQPLIKRLVFTMPALFFHLHRHKVPLLT